MQGNLFLIEDLQLAIDVTMKNTYHFWIFQENLYRILLVMEQAIHFEFSDTDYDSILYSLMDTDADKGVYYEHPFIGTEEDIYIAFARDGDWIETNIIFISVRSDNPETLQIVDIVNTVQALWHKA